VEAGLAAVAGEPFRESAHHALITAYLAEGNGHEALGLFERYRDTMREELGVEPSRELAELMGRVRHTQRTPAPPR
jgi:DNA-binding SARP family transcriptional activator